MKNCPYCGEKIQTTAKKCRFCGERLGQEESKSNKVNNKGVIRRLLKLTYFLFSIPIALFLILIAIDSRRVHRGLIEVVNYYQLIINIILIILGYILLTDFAKRVYSYLAEGKFEGFLKIKSISKNSKIGIIVLMIILGLLSIGSYKLNNECTGANEQFNDNGVCGCEEGYIREGTSCIITIKKEIINQLPNGGKLREIKEIPNNPNTYIGIYVENEIVNDDSSDPYDTCRGEVEGQSIEGDYYIFSYEKGKITSNLPISLDEFKEYGFDNIKLRLSYKNTKKNNYNLYGGPKPINEQDEKNIERTNLINLKDYNGDGINNEFLVISYIDGMCGHNTYLVAGFDNNTRKAIIYGIKGNDGIRYRRDNFIPDDKGNVKTGRECGDHGADTEMKNIFKFDKDQNMYVLVSSKERQCSVNEL